METEAVHFELPSFQEAPAVALTERAASKIRAFAESKPEAAGKRFRVYLEGGGCSGFQYGFRFDDRREDDLVIPSHGVEVMVDPASLVHLKGSVVDYKEDLMGSGFVVQNPNAKSSCGCGQSFSA